MNQNLLDKIKSGARAGVLLVGGLGVAGLTNSAGCDYRGLPNLQGDCQAREVHSHRKFSFDPRLPDMVFCNYWNDNGDGIMTADELSGGGKHTFDCGETFQIYGLNRTGRTISAEIRIYTDEKVLVSTSGQITVAPGEKIWSEKALGHNSPHQQMYTVQFLEDGRTVRIDNFKINPSEIYGKLIDNHLRKKQE